MTAPWRRPASICFAALTAGSVFAGCGAQPVENYAPVRAFTASLAQGRVSELDAATAATATTQYRALIRVIGVKPSVSLAGLAPGAAELHWSWPVPGGPWDYTTTLRLTSRAKDIWRPQWSPEVVIPGMTRDGRLLVTHPRGHRAPLLLADGKPLGTLRLGGLANSIQQADDNTLGGSPGTRITMIEPDQTPVTLVSYRPTNGHSLTLTIKRNWQQKAEAIVNQVGPQATLIAIRPSTGAIVASAGNYAAGQSDLATWAHSAPGSTWKTVDSLALIRARHFTPNSIVTCPAHYTVLGFTFKNDMYYPPSALGDIALKTAVANSCNTAMVSQHAQIDYAEIKDAATTLGLTIDHNLGFPAFFGQLPAPANEFVKAEDMIGQGDVLVSPMAMAVDIASIERGATVVPWVIRGFRPSVPANVRPLTATEDAYLKTIFHQVVVNGTASGLLGLPGGPIIAKTGTAEFIQNGQDLNHTWMIAAQGDLAVCVYFSVGNFGADTSGPLLRQFLAEVGPQ